MVATPDDEVHQVVVHVDDRRERGEKRRYPEPSRGIVGAADGFVEETRRAGEQQPAEQDRENAGPQQLRAHGLEGRWPHLVPSAVTLQQPDEIQVLYRVERRYQVNEDGIDVRK